MLVSWISFRYVGAHLDDHMTIFSDQPHQYHLCLGNLPSFVYLNLFASFF